MSKKKLSFRVGQGLAVAGLAATVGVGCPKEQGHTVNPVPVEEPAPVPVEEVKVNVVESPPAQTNGTVGTNGATNGTNGTNGATNGTNGADPVPKLVEPIRVNTPPPNDL